MHFYLSDPQCVHHGVRIEVQLQLQGNYAYMHEQVTKKLVYTLGRGRSSTGGHPFNVNVFLKTRSNKGSSIILKFIKKILQVNVISEIHRSPHFYVSLQGQ